MFHNFLDNALAIWRILGLGWSAFLLCALIALLSAKATRKTTAIILAILVAAMMLFGVHQLVPVW